MILLDTSVLLAAYRRRTPRGAESEAAVALRRMIESGLSLGIPAGALQEVLGGVRDRAQFQELQAHLTAFSVAPPTIDDHIAAARLAVECRAQRMKCKSQTMLVVAHAARAGWRLFTLDRETAAVARVAGVEVVTTRETASDGRR